MKLKVMLSKPQKKEEYMIYSVSKRSNQHHGNGLRIRKENEPKSDLSCRAQLKVKQTDISIIATHSNSENDNTVRNINSSWKSKCENGVQKQRVI